MTVEQPPKPPECLEDLLVQDEPAIVGAASSLVAKLGHYCLDGADEAHRRVEALHHQLLQAVRTRDLMDLRAYAARIARERRDAGFELGEIEAAFAALEAAIRLDALVRLPIYDQTFALALAHTALRHAIRSLDAVFGATPGSDDEVDLSPLFELGARGA
jgi:hypothetical protein